MKFFVLGATGGVGAAFVSQALLGTLLRRCVFAAGLVDSSEMEGLIESSDRDWTVVRPPRLVDGPPSASPRASALAAPVLMVSEPC